MPVYIATIGLILLLIGFVWNMFFSPIKNVILYNFINFVGAAIIATDCMIRHAIPAGILNIIWSGVALSKLIYLLSGIEGRRGGS